VPQGFATVATESVKKQHAETLRQRAHKEAKLVADAEALAATINAQAIEVAAKVGETGKLYGSVTTEMLAEALGAKGLNIDKKDITILADEVKELGEYEAVVKLYKGIKGSFKFNVVAE
jgi:large subunit ribosomal protein L9